MNNKQYFERIKYYCIVFLIAFVPIAVVSYFLWGKTSELVMWIINGTMLLGATFVGMICEKKIKEKKALKQDKNKDMSDPFAD